MTDASIGIEIDARLARSGGAEVKRSLEDIEAGARATAETMRQTTAGIGRSFQELQEKAGRAFQGMAYDAKLLKERLNFNDLQASVDPAVAALKRYQDVQRQVRVAVQAGAASQDEANRILAIAKTQYDATAAASKRLAAGGVGAFGSMGNAAQMAGYQVGDFFVQVSSGQGVLRPLIQQGTQFVQAFGPWGAVLGAAGAIVGSLAVAFLDLGQAEEEAAKEAEEAAEAFQDLQDHIDDTKVELDAMANAFERATLKAAALNEKLAAYGESGALNQLERAESVDEIYRALNELEKAQQEGLKATLDAAAVRLGIQDRRDNPVVASIEEEIEANEKLAAAMRTSRREYEITREELAILADEGFHGSAEEARQLAERLVGSRGTIDAIKDAGREAERAADRHKKLEQSLNDEVDANEELIKALRVSEHEYEVVSRKLAILEKGFQGTEAEARAFAETLIAQEKQLEAISDGYDELERASEEAAREQARVWENASENIQDAIADAVFEGGNLFDNLKDVAKRAAAEIAAAMVFRPLISPVIAGAQQSLGLGGGGISVPGFGGGMIGGGGGFDLSSLLYNAGGASGFSSFATTGIGEFLGLSRALPRGGELALTAFGGQATQAFGRLTSLGGTVGAFGGNLLANALLGGDRGIGADIGSTIGAVAGSFIPIPVVGPMIGSFLGNAIGGLFGGRPTEGETLEARLGGSGNIVAVGVDNGGSMSAAQQLADDFQRVIEGIVDVTGGNFGSGFRVSQSAKSGLRLDAGDSWMHFSSPDQLVNYLVDTQLTGGDPALTRAARLSDASSIEGLFADLQTAQQIQTIISAANDNLSPLEIAIKQVNDSFGELIENAQRLGFSTSELVRLRNEETQALRDQYLAQQEALVSASETNLIGFFQALGDPIRSIQSGLGLSNLSPLSPQERLNQALGGFRSTLDDALGGDLASINTIGSSAQSALQVASSFFPVGTQQYTDIFREVNEGLARVIGDIEGRQADAFTAAGIDQVAAIDRLNVNISDLIGELISSVEKMRNELAQLREAA